MPISVTCYCGKSFVVESELAGREMQCQCGNILTVPKPSHVSRKRFYTKYFRMTYGYRRRFFRPAKNILYNELMACYGFLVYRQQDEIGLEKFSQIQTDIEEIFQNQTSFLSGKSAKERNESLRKIREQTKKIGQYCLENGRSYSKFSEIAPVERQAEAIHGSFRSMEMIHSLLQNTSTHFSLFMSGKALLIGSIVILLAALAFFPPVLLAVVAFTVLAIACSWFFQLFSRRRELHRLQKIWQEYLKHTPETFIPPSISREWLVQIFKQNTWRRWQYPDLPEVVMPEGLRSDFIPDIVFPQDNPPQFGEKATDDVVEWCEQLYRYCYDAFAETAAIQFGFFYEDHLPRIETFLHYFFQAMGEIQQSDGRELVFVARGRCGSSKCLGVLLDLLNPLFHSSKFPNDRNWRTTCELFETVQMAMDIYDAKNIVNPSKDLQRPEFVEVFTALRQCLYQLAQRRPLLIIIENLVMCDPLTLRFFQSLAQERRNHRICFLVSYQSEVFMKNTVLQEVVLFLQKYDCWKSPETESVPQLAVDRIIARETSWDLLSTQLSAAITMSGTQVFSIKGANGTGKTFLVQQFLSAYQQGTAPFWLVEYNFRHHIEDCSSILQPVARILESFKAERGFLQASTLELLIELVKFLRSPIDPRSADFQWAATVGGTMQEVSQYDFETLSQYEIVKKRQEILFDKLVEAFTLISQHKPIVIFLDDFHIADVGTLQFFINLVKASNPPIFIIFTWDPNEIDERSMFPSFIKTLEATQRYSDVEIGNFPPEDMVYYINETLSPNLLAESSESPFVQVLSRVTKGNPLLLNETLKVLVEQRQLHAVHGCWLLKGELEEHETSSGRIVSALLHGKEHNSLRIILRCASCYGCIFPLQYLDSALDEYGISPQQIRKALSDLNEKNFLVQPSYRSDMWQFRHPQFQEVFYSAIPQDEKIQYHKYIIHFLEQNSPDDIARLLHHAERVEDWHRVTVNARTLGRNTSFISGLTSSAQIYDRGIAAARFNNDIATILRFYLLKSETFPSKKSGISSRFFAGLVIKGEWPAVFQWSSQTKDKERTCETLLKAIESLDSSARERITSLIEHLQELLPGVESEFIRVEFLHRLMPLMEKADTLKLRSIVEKTISLIDKIYNPISRAESFLSLQKRLKGMDLDLIESVSNRISSDNTGKEKALAIYYTCSFLAKNIEVLERLLEAAREISNPVYQMMAMRGMAEQERQRDPQIAFQIIQRLLAAVKDIATHSQRIDTVLTLLTGEIDGFKQPPFQDLIGSFAAGEKNQLMNSLVDILVKTPERRGRTECLTRSINSISILDDDREMQNLLKVINSELKNIDEPLIRAKGLIDFSRNLVVRNPELAYRCLEEGFGELESALMPKTPRPEEIQPMTTRMMKIEQFHAKKTLSIPVKDLDLTIEAIQATIETVEKVSPAIVSRQIWERIIAIIRLISKNDEREELFASSIVALFPLHPSQAVDLLGELKSDYQISRVFQGLLELTPDVIEIDEIEKSIMETPAIRHCGRIFVQSVASRDLGRARRLLKYLPDSIDNKLAYAQLCSPPGNRLREIINILPEVAEKDMEKVFSAIISLLTRGEYDQKGSFSALEALPDCYPEKISALSILAVTTQEVDPKLALEALMRVPILIEKHIAERGGKHDKKITQCLEVVEEWLPNLHPAFIKNHMDALLLQVERLSDTFVQGIFIGIFCQLISQIATEEMVYTIDRINKPELRSQAIQGLSQYLPTPLTMSIDTQSTIQPEKLECIASLGVIESTHRDLGRIARRALRENLAALRSPLEQMDNWLLVLRATAGWDNEFSRLTMQKILEISDKIPQQEVALYHKLIHIVWGLPGKLREEFIEEIIDHLVSPRGDRLPCVHLQSRGASLANAIQILNALLPFDSSYAHSFVKRLLAIPPTNANFVEWQNSISQFLYLTRGLVPERENEWIAEAIARLDSIEEEPDVRAQEDQYLLRALSMAQLARDLSLYDPEKAIQSAQRVIQLTEYANRRYRLQRYIILQLFSLLDTLQADIVEEVPNALLPIKIERLKCAHSHLQPLGGITPDQTLECLRQEKSALKRIFDLCLSAIRGELPAQDAIDLEKALVASHEKLRKELENAFQKVLEAKPGPGRTQAFFILAQALCLIDDESLENWPAPWFHRMVRLAGAVDVKQLKIAGDDLLRPDERDEFALLVQRVALIFPRGSLLLVDAMFAREKTTEVPSNPDAEISPEQLKNMIPKGLSHSLVSYCDRLLTDMTMEWAEYGWKEGFLLVSVIHGRQAKAQAIRRLVRKSCDFYPESLAEICDYAYDLLQKLSYSLEKMAALTEIAVRIANLDPVKLVEIVDAIEPHSKQLEVLERIVDAMEMEVTFIFMDKLPRDEFKRLCAKTILCKLPEDSVTRIAYIRRLWEMAQKIEDSELRISLMKDIIRIGIRDKDIKEQSKNIGNLLFEMWENSSRVEIELALQLVSTSFPPLIKILDARVIREIFEILCHPEYLDIEAWASNEAKTAKR